MVGDVSRNVPWPLKTRLRSAACRQHLHRTVRLRAGIFQMPSLFTHPVRIFGTGPTRLCGPAGSASVPTFWQLGSSEPMRRFFYGDAGDGATGWAGVGGCASRRRSRPRLGETGCCGSAVSFSPSGTAAARSARRLATSSNMPPTRSMMASVEGSLRISAGRFDFN